MISLKYQIRLWVLVVAGIFNQVTNGQEIPEAVTIGQKYEIRSLVLDETRPYLVYTPRGYDESDKEYPVMYLLDGDWNFHHTTATVSFLSHQQRMPEMIVVGISNTTDRTRDLTPEILGEDQGRFPTAGKADALVQFIKTELIPQINRTYRTKSYRMLVGHSFGGLFAIHTLINHPEIFDSYLAISPSLWWDDNRLVNQAKAYFKPDMDLLGHLYMTMGNEGGAMLGGAWKLSAVLKEQSPASFTWDFALMEDETHGSVPQKSTINGLEFIFADWILDKQMEVFMVGGLASIDDHFKKLVRQFGFAPEVQEADMNQLGYRMLRSGLLDHALDVFRRNTELYPESANVWDSYAEALLEKGDKNKAIKFYKKSYEMNPGNQNAVMQLIKLGVPKESFVKEVKIPVKTLRRYAGTYRMEAGFNIAISLEGNQLFGHPENAGRQQLVPVTENRFYISGNNGAVEFHIDEAGNISGLTLNADGQVFKGSKIE